MSRKNSITNWWPLIFIGLVIFIVIMLFTLGSFDIVEEISSEESYEERRRKAELRNRKLKYLIEQKGKLKIKLLRKFRWKYFSLATGVILLFGAGQIGLYYLLKVWGLGNIILWDGAFFGAFSGIHIIFFRKKFSLLDYVKYVELKVQNNVYKKYINIDEQITMLKEESKELEEFISAIEKRLLPLSGEDNQFQQKKIS